MTRRFLTLLFLTFIATPALAEEKLAGSFTALKRCEAYQSKNHLTNPGKVYIEEGLTYAIKNINKAGGDWYQIRIPGAPMTENRWVASNCGIHFSAGTEPPRANHTSTNEFVAATENEATDLLLALSWQPAFCESKPSKPECRQLNEGLLPITETQLSLHGLWPQPNGNFYCGVSKAIKDLDTANRWSELPAPQLDNATAERLAIAMPGTASFLERHEWVKHGTCFFGDNNGDEYFDDSLLVMNAINQSPVGRLLAQNVGSTIKTSQIREAFDATFGAGAGERVQVQCKGDQGRVLIQEITITMRGEISATADIGALIRAGAPQTPGCLRGIIDPAGLQ